ncbi:MAG: hypothetical protein JW860_06875 [Sedimentisphaerales bacterium]|nr:hypothetical protein [Sedimentisphaerales bacterium]
MNQIGQHQEDWGKHFKLMADIDLGYHDGLDGRPIFNCIGTGSIYGNTYFTGIFDGNGKTIRNFTYSTYKSYSVAIFAYLDGPDGEIRDLMIEAPLVNYIGHGYCGALVGRSEGRRISNCHVIGGSILWDSNVGALVGDNWADIYNCSATTTVTGTDDIWSIYEGVHYPRLSSQTSVVKGCHIFYNNSSFDGNNPGANDLDDAIGETCNNPTNTYVNALDTGGVRDNPRNFLNPAPINDPYDFNRDANVNAIDFGIARDHTTNFITALNLISIPGDD